MGFYRNVQAELKTHYKDQEEYIRVGEIRYIESLGIVYRCVNYDDFCDEHLFGGNSSLSSCSTPCSFCIFGDESKFPGCTNCKMCGRQERPDHTEVIFRPVEI